MLPCLQLCRWLDWSQAYLSWLAKLYTHARCWSPQTLSLNSSCDPVISVGAGRPQHKEGKTLVEGQGMVQSENAYDVLALNSDLWYTSQS